MLSPTIDRHGSPALKQWITSPSVYLDHWALMDFAHEREAGDRFTRVLVRRNGTALISWLHLLEMSTVKSVGTAAEIEAFLDRLDLHVAFLQPLPDTVVENENRLLSVPPELWDSAPHLDQGLLRLVYLFSKPPAVIGFSGLFSSTQSHEFDELRAEFERGMQNSEQALALKRQQFLDDRGFEKAVRSPSSGPQIAAPTRYVVRETINALIRDRKKSMAPKEWIDLGHMEVSVSYADFVLLDKAWAHLADVVRLRLEGAGLLSHFAEVFSERTLDDFWKAFDV